jgi:hypothetical protein
MTANRNRSTAFRDKPKDGEPLIWLGRNICSKEQLKTSLLEQRAQRGPEMMVYMDYDPVVDIWIIHRLVKQGT